MKTFSEALATLPITHISLGKISNARTLEADEETRQHQFYSRYAAIADEALNTPEMKEYMKAWMRIAKPESALFTAFMTGLIVGMEMEKQG